MITNVGKTIINHPWLGMWIMVTIPLINMMTGGWCVYGIALPTLLSFFLGNSNTFQYFEHQGNIKFLFFGDGLFSKCPTYFQGETSQAVLNPCRLRHTNPRHWISLGHGPKNTRIMIFLLVKIALLSAASGRLAMAFAKLNHAHNPESNHTFVPTITPNEVPKLALSIVHWEGLSTPNKSSLFRAVPRGEHIFIYRSSNQKRSPLCGWFSVYNPTLIYGSSMDIFLNVHLSQLRYFIGLWCVFDASQYIVSGNWIWVLSSNLPTAIDQRSMRWGAQTNRWPPDLWARLPLNRDHWPRLWEKLGWWGDEKGDGRVTSKYANRDVYV